jgi:hypothetical protein
VLSSRTPRDRAVVVQGTPAAWVRRAMVLMEDDPGDPNVGRSPDGPDVIQICSSGSPSHAVPFVVVVFVCCSGGAGKLGLPMSRFRRRDGVRVVVIVSGPRTRAEMMARSAAKLFATEPC